MNIKDIRALAQILESTGLTALEMNEDALHIRLEKTPPVQNVTMVSGAPAAPIQVATPTAAATLAPATPKAQEGVVDFNGITEIKSPMVGVFYAAPSPDARPYVEVGDKVKKGDVLCIIEAMKLMNELPAETDGEIVDICVKTGELVEYGQPLFKIF